MARTDTHRPSAIIPAEYVFVAYGYMKIESLGDAMFMQMERKVLAKHMEKTGGTYSQHEHKGNCHICGAHCIYTAIFHHEPTNSYIKTGLECLEKMECGEDGSNFRKQVRAALEAQAGKRKAKAVLEEAGYAQAYDIWSAGYTENESRPVAILRDVVGKLVQYGSLSPNQLGLIGKLLDQVNNAVVIAKKREDEKAALVAKGVMVPKVEGRITVEGSIVSMREEDTIYGRTTKILVQHNDGWKIWGTLPNAIANAERGCVVRFAATVTRSDKDSAFGFFNRPSKAEIVRT